MKLRSLVIAAALLASPAAALAQPAPWGGAPSPRLPPPMRMDPALRDPQIQLYNVQSAMFRESLTRQALMNASPERISRAERVAALVDHGRCDAAATLAEQEGDRRMAARVHKICR